MAPAERFYLFCVADKDFLWQFNQKELPDGHMSSGESIWVCLLMREAGLTVSNGPARRLDKQEMLSLTMRELIMQIWKTNHPKS